ncbi:hypothetical protein ACLKA7_010632 [Drosophila subpalustris]
MHYAKWDPEAVLREQNKSFNNLRKFALAFWKTFNIQKSYKCYYAKVFLISLVFLPVLSLIRSLTAPEVQDKMIYSPVDVDNLDIMHLELGNLQHNSSVLVPKLYFTPNCVPFERIIQLTVEKLNLVGYDSVADNSEMDLRMQKTNYLAGVRFLGAESNISELPIELDYELRFPPVLRTSPSKMNPLFWPTKKLYTLAHKHGAQLVKTNYTGIPPAYFEEGFLQLQHAIAMSYIELKAGYKNLTKKGKAKIQMVRFPYRRFRRDEYIIHLKILLALTMVFMYAFPSYAIVKAITDENERGIMKMLRIEELNWCAWLVIIFILQVISSLFSLMILTPSLGTNSIFQYSNWLPIFCFLLCYVCANCSFILMIAVVVIKRSLNAKYALLIRLITIAPYPFILIFYYDISYGYKLLSCLSHDTGLAIGFYIILEFESSGEGFNWKNFSIPHFAGESFCIPHVVGMLLLDSILYMLILIYFHYKYPPEVECMSVDRQTIAKSWYYPLKAIYKRVMTRSFINDFLWFLVVHLTFDEEELDNKVNVPVNIRDKNTQTVRPTNRVDQGTMTRRNYSPSTSEKDMNRTLFKPGPPRVVRPAPYKRRVPLEAPSSTSTESSEVVFLKNRFVPEPLNIWSSLGDSSYTSVDLESTRTSDSRARSTIFYKNAVVNEPLFDKNHGIQVINVRKHVGGTDYLKDITMTIHPNEITVILKQQNDHNMFLSKIISGEVAMTSGQVIVDGHDIRHYKGTDTLCTILPTDSIVFNQLTTCENLYFYMHLRGMRNYRQIIREIYKYLELLQMEMDEAEILADTLSFGQARLVSLCCALCGGNHAVIVDDPCLGLRQKWRFKMWELLKDASHNRVVVVKTHFNDEAELLGDRIAVIYCGYLQCFDRNKHLRDKFCNNYHLHSDVIAAKKVNDIEFLSLLRKHFPLGADVKCLPSSGEIDVTLPGGHEIQLAGLLNELELKGNQMGLGLLWVKQKTLRDVFMKDFKDQIDHNELNRLLYACLDTSLNEEDELRRTFQQFRACMHKKMIQYIRYFWIPITIFVLLSGCVFMNHQSSHFSHLPKVNICISIYPDTQVLMKLHEGLQSEQSIYTMTKGYEFHHKRIMDRDGDSEHSLKYLHGRRELVPYILFLEMISILRVETFYVAAVAVSSDEILCYWNNKLLHSAPISLNMMHNAYAYIFLGSESEIRLANHPIKFSNELILEQYNIHSTMKLGMGNLLILILCTIIAMMVIPLISEFTTGNRRVIYLSGNSMNMYWITHILADMLVFTVVTIYLVVLLVVHDVVVNSEKRNYDDVYLVLSIFSVLFLFGMAVLPFVYLLAALFGRIFFGFMITLLILGGSSILINLVIQLSEIPGWHSIYNLFIWSPTMNMYRGLRNVHVNRALRRVCEQLGGCRYEEACCHLADYMDYNYPGILSEIVVLVLLQILYGLLLMTVIKNPFFFEDFIRVIRERFMKTNPIPTVSSVYSDVRDEKDEVDNLQTGDLDKYPLVFKDVSKRVGKSNRLTNVSFLVHPREVFGILGISTSGKSEIINMTVGSERISSGDIYVQGVSVNQYPTNTYKHLGYCPWGNALLGHMTVREILHFYCLLNGRKLKYVPGIINNLCKALHLDKYMSRRIDRLGFSQRRQLTVGISVLSSTKTVMMDEPTRGVSQESKILIWQLIHLLKHVGRTVVMTTEDIDETIELCDYIAIIVNGSLQKIGTVNHLTSFYSRGCSVEIYMEKVIYTRNRRRIQDTYVQLVGSNFFSDYYSSDDELDRMRSSDFSFSSTEDNSWTRKAMRFKDVRSFMREELPFAELQAQFGQYLQYYIPFEAMPLSDVFKAMAAVKEELDVDSYRITRTSLSEIYEKSSRQKVRAFDQKQSRESFRQM